MKTNIKLLLLDDDPGTAIAQIEDHLRDQFQAVAESIAYPNDGFECIIPARGLLPEVLLSVQANAAEITQPDIALAWASSRLNEQSYNGILIDDSWNNDSDDRSGHELILVGLSKLFSILAMPYAQLAIFSGHLESNHRPGSRNIAVASKIEAALPPGLKARTRLIPKSKSEMFGNWIQFVILNRPREKGKLHIEIRGDHDIYIASETVPFVAATYKHVVLAYLCLVADGKCEGKPQKIADQIKQRYIQQDDQERAQDKLSKKIDRLFPTLKKAAEWGRHPGSGEEVSRAVNLVKEAIRPYLSEARKCDLKTLEDTRSMKVARLLDFIQVVNNA